MLRPFLPALGLAASALAQTAEFTPLPAGFQPVNLSDDGRTIVGKLINGTYPARWTARDGVVPLTGPEGQVLRGTAWSASADGSVIVGTTSFNGQIPFRWTAETGMVPLTTQPFYGLANGYAVSNDGTVAAGDGSVDQSAPGFVWDPNQGLRNLPSPIGFTAGTVATLSGDGRVVAGSVSQDGQGRFIRWDARTLAMETLTLHDGSGQPLVGAVTDSNQDGDIIVGRAVSQSGGIRPVIWTTTGLQFIGAANGVARRVTRDGLVVVGSTSPSGGAAWIWTDGLGVMDLKLYLEEYHGISLPANTTLTQVFGISADGRTLCGLGSPSNWVVHLPTSRPSDFNRDETIDLNDLSDFLDCFEGHHLLPPSSADVNQDGITDFFDLLDFLDDFER